MGRPMQGAGGGGGEAGQRPFWEGSVSTL
jgi:hypothetical protein